MTVIRLDYGDGGHLEVDVAGGAVVAIRSTGAAGAAAAERIPEAATRAAPPFTFAHGLACTLAELTRGRIVAGAEPIRWADVPPGVVPSLAGPPAGRNA